METNQTMVSPGTTTTASALPPNVVQCLENARFLHLATCTNNQPHVSLMNYTYLPSTPYEDSTGPVIVMTATPGSKKFENLVENPNVSLLVHDWVSHRPLASQRLPSGTGGSPTRDRIVSPLASLLLSLNTSSISSISATINGTAKIIGRGTEEEKYFRSKHVENNTFDNADVGGIGFTGDSHHTPTGQGRTEPTQEMSMTDGVTSPSQEQASSRRESEPGWRFVDDEDVRVIVVTVEDVRTSDWNGLVKDFRVRAAQ